MDIYEDLLKVNKMNGENGYTSLGIYDLIYFQLPSVYSLLHCDLLRINRKLLQIVVGPEPLGVHIL